MVSNNIVLFMPVHVHSFGAFLVIVSENFQPLNNSAFGQFHREPIIKVWQDLIDVFCRNPTLAKCGGESQHLEKVRTCSPPGFPNV